MRHHSQLRSRDLPFSFLPTLAVLLLSSIATAQSPPGLPIYADVDGPFANGVGHVGRAAAVLGDINCDGADDFVISATFDPVGVGTEIRAVSGKDLSTVYSITSAVGETIGVELTLVGDIDVDGIADFASLETQPLAAGGFNRDLVIRSGFTGQVIYTLSGISQQTTVMASLGDLNADGASEFVLGDAASGGGAGLVTIHDGLSGAVLLTLGSVATSFGFGGRPLGDVNGDGFGDFSVQSGASPTQAPGTRNVFVYTSGPSGLPYQVAQQYTGFVRANGVPDVDGDGANDYVISYAAGFPASPIVGPNGALELHSGATHALLWMVPNPPGPASGYIEGDAPISVGDIDGDGLPEIANATFFASFGGGMIGPRILIHSGLDGRVLFRADGDAGFPSTSSYSGDIAFGRNMETGDFDGDGLGDLLVSNAGANNDQGYVRIYSGTTLFDPQAAAGNVTPPMPGGNTADVLRMGVSGSGAPTAGGGARSVFFDVGDDLGVWMARPPLNPGWPTPFALFGKVMTGSDHTTHALPFDVGAMCFTPEFLDPFGTEPLFTLMNTFGGAPALLPASLAFFGAPGHEVGHSGPFPFPTEFWLQGLVADTQKPWPQVSITNALRVVVR